MTSSPHPKMAGLPGTALIGSWKHAERAAQAVYTALKETEQRATDVLPLWKLQFLHPLIPRQRKASEAVALIRQTTERLIAKCREMVDAEEQVCQAPTIHLV